MPWKGICIKVIRIGIGIDIVTSSYDSVTIGLEYTNYCPRVRLIRSFSRLAESLTTQPDKRQ